MQQDDGRRVGELGLWADSDHRDQVIRRLHQEGSVNDVECRLRRKSGVIRWVRLSMDILETVAKPVVCVMFVDITDSKRIQTESDQQTQAQSRLAHLSPRERAVLELVVTGHMNKVIARKLDVSLRTVETYRACLMRKLSAQSLADLIRMALAAEPNPS